MADSNPFLFNNILELVYLLRALCWKIDFIKSGKDKLTKFFK